jgi:hydroxymethylpyrimidine pyrophosphatase-like HAD family hydrolase
MNDPMPAFAADLLHTVADASGMLRDAIRSGDWLDAYLLAAGINQVLEDDLHRDLALVHRAARFLSGEDSPAARGPGWILDRLYAALFPLTSFLPGKSRRVRIQLALADFVQTLADAAAGLETPPAARLLEKGEAILKDINQAASHLQSEVMRLPSCFQSFDQQPADLLRLAQAFKARWPNMDRPLEVVGVRTSGSYLAPLQAACLKAAGFREVSAWTMRPSQGFLWHERLALRRLNRRKGLALVTDDAPITGGSLLSSIHRLEESGLSPDAVVLVLQVFGEARDLPVGLQGVPAVILPWQEWAIQARLEPEAVKQALAGFWRDTFDIETVQRLPLPAPDGGRGHASALYHLALRDCRSGAQQARQVFVKGTGLGYFGEHAHTVARALPAYLPRVFGCQDGLLYREWLPEEARLVNQVAGQEGAYASRLADYVAARRSSLPAARDASQQLNGTHTAWEVASSLLSLAYERGSLLAQPVLTDRLARRLLDVERPSIIDGKMEIENWFLDLADHGSPLKIGFGERDFSHLDLFCYDPVYDLAGLAASCGSRGFSESLRRAYQDTAGEHVDPERWLLYQWVHLWDHQRQSETPDLNESRAPARLFQRYFSELYFKDLDLQDTGWLCAIDVDGVLETHPFGFPQLSPSSALALRALIRHGFRPILSTGRSIDEVRERCQAYHLAGGVAEYGAVVYNHLTGKTEGLLTYPEQDTLEQVRLALTDLEGVFLDPDYTYAVRAFQVGEKGRRTGLDPETINRVLSKIHRSVAVQVIIGKSQTDFMVKRINKKVGLQHLIMDLDPKQCNATTPLVFAVGDSVADLPMFDLAARVFMPAHASADLNRPNIQRTRGSFQAGFKQAVGAMLTHQPGTCSLCQWTPESQGSSLFLQLLASHEEGQWGKMRQTLRLAAQMRGG